MKLLRILRIAVVVSCLQLTTVVVFALAEQPPSGLFEENLVRGGVFDRKPAPQPGIVEPREARHCYGASCSASGNRHSHPHLPHARQESAVSSKEVGKHVRGVMSTLKTKLKTPSAITELRENFSGAEKMFEQTPPEALDKSQNSAEPPAVKEAGLRKAKSIDTSKQPGKPAITLVLAADPKEEFIKYLEELVDAQHLGVESTRVYVLQGMRDPYKEYERMKDPAVQSLLDRSLKKVSRGLTVWLTPIIWVDLEKLPSQYRTETSPTWFIKHQGTEHVLEGAQRILSYFDHNGDFIAPGGGVPQI